MTEPTPDAAQRARAWWAAVSTNSQAPAPSPDDQLALVSLTRFLPHIIGFILHPIPALQCAALYALQAERRNLASNPGVSLAIAQLAKTPDRFDAAVLETIKPGLSEMVAACRDSDNFAELLADYLDDTPFDPDFAPDFDADAPDDVEGETRHG